MIELSICDICNIPMTILIYFLFLLSFFSSFSSFKLLKCFVSCNLFLMKNFQTEKLIKLMFFSDFILQTFKKFKCKFYHSTKGHNFQFWSCYIRYALLIIDKFLVEFSLLMPLLHLYSEITYRFIHLRISSQFCFLYLCHLFCHEY